MFWIQLKCPIRSFVSQSSCSELYSRVGISITSSHLCAVSSVGDTCAGDSGSGLIRSVQ